MACRNVMNVVFSNARMAGLIFGGSFFFANYTSFYQLQLFAKIQVHSTRLKTTSHVNVTFSQIPCFISLVAFYCTGNMVVYKVILYALDDGSMHVKIFCKVACPLDEHYTYSRVCLEHARCME